MAQNTAVIPVTEIEERILTVRGHKVMLDADLANLCGVTTKRLPSVFTEHGAIMVANPAKSSPANRADARGSQRG